MTDPGEVTQIRFEVINESHKPAQLGLVALEQDLTFENEMRYFLGGAPGHESASDFSLLHTRIKCDDEISPETLTNMETQFADALRLFPRDHKFDVIGYGCTSASLLIGEQRVQEIIHTHVTVTHVTTPLTAVKRGLAELNVQKIGYLAPYISNISSQMCSELSDAGFKVIVAATFGEDRDSVVGCISPTSIFRAIEELVNRAPDIEAVFVSCTSLKCASIIAEAEQSFDIPILSSNSAIAWDIARLARIKVSPISKGSLYML